LVAVGWLYPLLHTHTFTFPTRGLVTRYVYVYGLVTRLVVFVVTRARLHILVGCTVTLHLWLRCYAHVALVTLGYVYVICRSLDCVARFTRLWLPRHVYVAVTRLRAFTVVDLPWLYVTLFTLRFVRLHGYVTFTLLWFVAAHGYRLRLRLHILRFTLLYTPRYLPHTFCTVRLRFSLVYAFPTVAFTVLPTVPTFTTFTRLRITVTDVGSHYGSHTVTHAGFLPHICNTFGSSPHTFTTHCLRYAHLPVGWLRFRLRFLVLSRVCTHAVYYTLRPVTHGCGFTFCSTHAHAAHSSRHTGATTHTLRSHVGWLGYTLRFAVLVTVTHRTVHTPHTHVWLVYTHGWLHAHTLTLLWTTLVTFGLVTRLCRTVYGWFTVAWFLDGSRLRLRLG